MPTLAFEHLASWSETGSGISSFVLRPSYQASVASIIGNMRAVPDIAADANPETGAWVLDSGNGGWYIVGGTSLPSPTIVERLLQLPSKVVYANGVQPPRDLESARIGNRQTELFAERWKVRQRLG
jgi:hypothetical protein